MTSHLYTTEYPRPKKPYTPRIRHAKLDPRSENLYKDKYQQIPNNQTTGKHPDCTQYAQRCDRNPKQQHRNSRSQHAEAKHSVSKNETRSSRSENHPRGDVRQIRSPRTSPPPSS